MNNGRGYLVRKLASARKHYDAVPWQSLLGLDGVIPVVDWIPCENPSNAPRSSLKKSDFELLATHAMADRLKWSVYLGFPEKVGLIKPKPLKLDGFPFVVDKRVLGILRLNCEPQQQLSVNAVSILLLVISYVECAVRIELTEHGAVIMPQATLRDPSPQARSEQIVRQMLTYIWANYKRPITLNECAASLKFNAAYLSDLFSSTVGISFKRYLTMLRLQKAKMMLSNPSLRVSEVAYLLGFVDPNRFRLAFRDFTGFSPVKWRDHTNRRS